MYLKNLTVCTLKLCQTSLHNKGLDFNEFCHPLKKSLGEHCMAEQCCWTNNVAHYCFNNVVQHWWSNRWSNGCSRLLKQEKIILIEQACSLLLSVLLNQVLTVSMVEQCCNNIVIMAKQLCWQHCSLGAASGVTEVDGALSHFWGGAPWTPD